MYSEYSSIGVHAPLTIVLYWSTTYPPIPHGEGHDKKTKTEHSSRPIGS